MDRDEIEKGCLEQAGWAVKLGSPMYEQLLRRMAEDVREGGPCLAALEPAARKSRMIAPLMLLAAIHRMVLDGQLPEAARYYPSAGGTFEVDSLWPHFLAAVPSAVLPPGVQTNEVARSYALLPGFLEVARRTGLPMRLLEVGCSAGLNLRWDRFPWTRGAEAVEVIERRGCDLNPIDPTLDESRLTLLSFIWADQTERFGQLSVALDVAARFPAQLDRSDAAPWLREQLKTPSPGAATVVFHSVLTPYLNEESKGELRRTIEEAGARATKEAPLAWLSMEPGETDEADVNLTIWPGGERRLIAQSSFHGRNVRIL